MIKSNNDLLNLSYDEILKEIPDDKKVLIRKFINELNKREYFVRFMETCSFDEFEHVEHHNDFGTGFQVDGRAVPYFHPNRSFHDEIIWLNENVFYNDDCKFEDRLINAAIIKFYGPSNTISIITRGTGKDFIVYDRLINDDAYVAQCMKNLHDAVDNKEKIFGTTELRTSLQTEARNYTRLITTPYDKLLGIKHDPERKGRTSDIFHWFRELGPKFKEFYSTSPNMEESFEFLTSFRGIGNYYGYHFSTNLARMPKIGTKHLLRENASHGHLNEDDEFVAPGVGAMFTVNWFYEHLPFSINSKVGAHVIRAIREDQNEFFGFIGESLMHAETVSETGKFTTFGCEISCCQFGVFLRLRYNEKLARKRSKAPIGKETIGKSSSPEIADDCKIITEDMETIKTLDNFNKLPEGYSDPFPNFKLKDPSEFKRSSKLQKQLITKILDAANVISKHNTHGKADFIKIENAGAYGSIDGNFKMTPTDDYIKKNISDMSKKGIAKSLSKKPKKKSTVTTTLKASPEKQKMILDIITEIGLPEFSHNDVLSVVKGKGGLGLKLESNWKESWAIMQVLVKNGNIEKNGRKYKLSLSVSAK